MSQDKKKRAPRIKSFSLKECRYINQNDSEFELTNLSSTGIGIARKADDRWPAEGDKMTGTLRIQENEVPIFLQIVRKDGYNVGCAYAQDPIELKGLIYNMYDTEFSALELKKVNQSILREQPDGKPHWFFDGSGGELYFVERNGKIGRYSINFKNHHIEGAIDKRPIVRAELETGHAAVTMTDKVREQFLRFLNNIENLEDEYLQRLVALINEA